METAPSADGPDVQTHGPPRVTLAAGLFFSARFK